MDIDELSMLLDDEPEMLPMSTVDALPVARRVQTNKCWALLLRGTPEGCDPDFTVYGHRLQVSSECCAFSRS